MLHKAWNSKGEMPYCFPRSSIKFQGHTVQNITDFDPNWAFPDYRPVAAFKSLRFALLIYVHCFCHDFVVLLPEASLAFGYCRRLRLSVCVCVCVRPCVNHKIVRDITHHPFQLGSPNLDHGYKSHWLRSLLFLGVIDLDLQGQI